MQFLADAGISPKTVEFLTQLGHEAIHVRTLGLQRAADFVLVERARADGSVLITFDLDFGDILALGVLDKPSVIIFRLTDERADSVNQRLTVVLQTSSWSFIIGRSERPDLPEGLREFASQTAADSLRALCLSLM